MKPCRACSANSGQSPHPVDVQPLVDAQPLVDLVLGTVEKCHACLLIGHPVELAEELALNSGNCPARAELAA